MRPSEAGSDRELRTQEQRRFWSAKYAADPNFFGEKESHFAQWCLPYVEARPPGRRLIELGAGNGRDLRFFRGLGFSAIGVDCAGDVPAEALHLQPPLTVVASDALDFLVGTETGSIDVVYSNLFYNMDFTEVEHRRFFEEVHRVLRPGGRHLYCVRTVSDPWYGRGRQRGPDTFDSHPEGTTMHFFSPAYAAGLRADRFALLGSESYVKGKGDFPIHVLYVAERRITR